MHLSMTVRTKRDGVLWNVEAPVSKPNDVMGLQVGFVRCVGKGSWLSTQLTLTSRSALYQFGDVSVP